jgi:peptidyl-prolyl cis-trans isomerase C
VLVVAPLALQCHNGKNDRKANTPSVAVVNGEPITVDSFRREMELLRNAGPEFFGDRQKAIQVKRELLENLIDGQLLLQQARKQRVPLDPKVLESSVELIRQQYTPGGLMEEFLRKGKTPESFRRDTESSLLINGLLKREVVDRIAVLREEVTKYYEEHRADFNKPERVRVRQIVTKTEEQASDLRKQIASGASFAELAKKYSLGPEGKNGGDLGYFSKGQMPPAIEEACFALRSPEVSRVVASPYGYHLFQLIDRVPAKQLSLQEAWSEIEQKLVGQKVGEAEKFYLRKLRQDAKIERDLALLDRLQ